MRRVAQFEKVSYECFNNSCNGKFGEDLTCLYESIKMPCRATLGSAGYDFYIPFDIRLNVGSSITVPTGIRVRIDEGWVLKLYPRSGLGFKYRLELDNTVGIIDSDYYYSANEGHIMCKITNNGNENKIVELKAGSGFVQGIFVEYGITYDDNVVELRNGGFGSTDQKVKQLI